MEPVTIRLPRLAHEWFLVTRAFGWSGPYAHEENVRSDARQFGRYAIYRRRVIRFRARLVGFEGDWADERDPLEASQAAADES